MTNRQKNKSVRLSDDAYARAAKLAAEMRPKSTLQYVIEDAIQQYLDRAESAEKQRVPPAGQYQYKSMIDAAAERGAEQPAEKKTKKERNKTDPPPTRTA